MSIKIEIEHWEYDLNEEDYCINIIKELEVKNLGSNLMKCINLISDEDLTVFFDEYYPCSYTDINFEHSFPYILKEGKYEWHVPIEEVTVKEFMLTHDISEGESIRLREGGVGGGDYITYVSAIVEWIPILLNDIGMILTAAETYKKVMSVYHKMIGKNNKVASPYTFHELLKGKKAWTMKDLKSRTTLDENTIETMLLLSGFEKQGNTYLRTHNAEQKEACDIKDEMESREQALWGINGNNKDERSELLDAIHNLNLCMTSLKFQSDYNKSECFDIMLKIVDYHVESWSGYLRRGNNLHFVDLGEDFNCISEECLHNLAYSTGCLSGYTSHLCEVLDEKKITVHDNNL